MVVISKKAAVAFLGILAIVIAAGAFIWILNPAQEGKVQLSPTPSYPIVRIYSSNLGDHAFTSRKITLGSDYLRDSIVFDGLPDANGAMKVCYVFTQTQATTFLGIEIGSEDTYKIKCLTDRVPIGGAINYKSGSPTGYVYEGISGYVYEQRGCSSGSVQIYGFNGNSHTAYANINHVGDFPSSNGWTIMKEKSGDSEVRYPMMCAFSSQITGTLPLYRMNNGNDYALIVGDSAAQGAESAGYSNRVVEGYVFQNDAGGAGHCGDGSCNYGETAPTCGDCVSSPPPAQPPSPTSNECTSGTRCSPVAGQGNVLESCHYDSAKGFNVWSGATDSDTSGTTDWNCKNDPSKKCVGTAPSASCACDTADSNVCITLGQYRCDPALPRQQQNCHPSTVSDSFGRCNIWSGSNYDCGNTKDSQDIPQTCSGGQCVNAQCTKGPPLILSGGSSCVSLGFDGGSLGCLDSGYFDYCGCYYETTKFGGCQYGYTLYNGKCYSAACGYAGSCSGNDGIKDTCAGDLICNNGGCYCPADTTQCSQITQSQADGNRCGATASDCCPAGKVYCEYRQGSNYNRCVDPGQCDDCPVSSPYYCNGLMQTQNNDITTAKLLAGESYEVSPGIAIIVNSIETNSYTPRVAVIFAKKTNNDYTDQSQQTTINSGETRAVYYNRISYIVKNLYIGTDGAAFNVKSTTPVSKCVANGEDCKKAICEQTTGKKWCTLSDPPSCIDSSAQCTPPQCGDGIVQTNRGEECDGTNFGGKSCTSYGYAGGNLACGAVGTTSECKADTNGCTLAPGVSLLQWRMSDTGASVSQVAEGSGVRLVVERDSPPLPAGIMFNIYRTTDSGAQETIATGLQSTASAGRASAAWTASLDGASGRTKFWFNVNNGADKSNLLEITRSGQVNFNECRDYGNKDACNADSYGAAAKDPIRSEFICDATHPCKCIWSAARGGVCGFSGTRRNPSDINNPIGQCSMTTSCGECIDGEQVCSPVVLSGTCGDTQFTLQCGIALAEMPFFGFAEFVIGAFGVVVIYIFISRKKNKK